MQQDPHTGLSLKLLGPPELYWENELVESPPAKVFAMLCYLATRNEPVTRHELAELLWQSKRTDSVRVALHTLKKLPFAQKWLFTEENFVRVEAASDVLTLKQAFTKKHFAEVINIWQNSEAGQDTFLKGIEIKGARAFNNWLEEEREELHRIYIEALKNCIEAQKQSGDFESALQGARKLLEEDLLNEEAQQSVIFLEHLRGNTEGALEQFESYRRLLKEELDMEPSDDTLTLLKQIEQGGVSQAKGAILIRTEEDIPSLPSKLIGRNELMSQIDTLLKENERVLLHGFGGVGKTALAATTAAKHLSERGKALWFQVGNDDIESLFDSIARLFEAQKHISQVTNKGKAICELLSKEKISLLVIDDVWNAYALSKLGEAVPHSTALLVTSRQRYPKFKRVDVGRLERSASLELLSYSAKRGLQEDESASKLCETLGDHAFALLVAGVNLAVDKLSPEKLLRQIIDSPHNMKMPKDFAEEGRESFASLLNVSLQTLSDEAYEAFLGIGVLFTSSCTPQLLSLCLRRSEEEVEDALIELQRRALAERVAKAGSDVVIYNLHDLAFSFSQANNNIRKITLVRACYNFVKANHRNFEQLEAELSNILSSIETAQQGGDDKVVIDMMQALVLQGNAYYTLRGHNPRSLKLLEAAADAAKRNEKLDKAHYFKSKLGDACQDASGSLGNALSNYQEALGLARVIGDTHREAISMSLVGITHFKSDMPDGEIYLQEAYELARKNKDDFALDQILQYRKFVAERKENFEQAYKFCLEAVEVTERILGQTTTDYAKVKQGLFFALLNLGQAEEKLGRSDDVFNTFQKALQLAELQNNELWMARALQEIAKMHHKTGNKEAAQENYQKALTLYKKNSAHTDLEALMSLMQSEGYISTKTIV